MVLFCHASRECQEACAEMAGWFKCKNPAAARENYPESGSVGIAARHPRRVAYDRTPPRARRRCCCVTFPRSRVRPDACHESPTRREHCGPGGAAPTCVHEGGPVMARLVSKHGSEQQRRSFSGRIHRPGQSIQAVRHKRRPCHLAARGCVGRCGLPKPSTPVNPHAALRSGTAAGAVAGLRARIARSSPWQVHRVQRVSALRTRCTRHAFTHHFGRDRSARSTE